MKKKGLMDEVALLRSRWIRQRWLEISGRMVQQQGELEVGGNGMRASVVTVMVVQR